MSAFGNFGQNANNTNNNANNAQPAPTGGAFSNLGSNAAPGSAFGGGSLFGQQKPPAAGVSLFGPGANAGANAAAAPAPAIGGLFGGGNNTTAPATGGSLFGGGGANPPTPGGSLFGGNTNTTNNAAPAPATGSLFGGGNAANNALKPGSLFGGGAATGSGQPTGSLFGGNAGAAAGSTGAAAGGNTGSAAPAPGGLFSGGLFGAKPADSNAASNAPKPPGSLFGAPITANTNTPSTSAPATGAQPSLLARLGGDASAAPSASTSPAPAQGGLLGGNLFGKKPDAPATTTPAAGTSTGGFTLGGAKPSTPTPGGSLFGNTTNNTTSTPATGSLFGNKDGATTPGGTTANKDAATPAAGLNLFGAASANKPEEKKTTTASPFNLFGGGNTGAASTATSTEKKDAAPATAATTITAPAVSVAPPSMLRGKSIEEIVNRWSSELETHVREFTKYSTEVAVWDRALYENGNNLAALSAHVLAAEREQNDIDQSLDHIEQQQRDLGATLEEYEKQAEEILGRQGGSLRSLDTGPADSERDKNYMLATELHNHLDDLSSSLTQLIDSVNAVSLSAIPPSSSDAAKSNEDSMAGIAQVLSNHLESLNWINTSSKELEAKVGEVESRVRDAGISVNGNVGQGAALGSGTGGYNGRSRGFGVNR